MDWIKKNKTSLILVLMFIIGAGLLLYPTFADWWNSFHQSRAINTYMESVTSMDTDTYEQIISEAEAYNRDLAETGFHWKMTNEEVERYESVLKIDDTGIMGYVTISKIGIMLPIYHGTSEAVLNVAIGHLQETSLPVGGEGSHCVVSGHRGLPSARLFTDLDKLVEGDTFTLTVLNKTMTYEVDQIRTVIPTDLSALNIERGKDYCTLVTCTPYGINTHRLLVRGHRVENPNGDADVIADAIQLEPVHIAPFIAVPVLLGLMIGVFVSTGIRKRKWEEKNEANRALLEVAGLSPDPDPEQESSVLEAPETDEGPEHIPDKPE